MSHQRIKPGVKTGLSSGERAIYDGILSTYLRSCNHPDACRLLVMLHDGDYRGLLDWTERMSPQLYGDAASYFADAQIVALIRKFPFDSTEVPGINPELTAVKKFLASEHRCKRVNQLFRARRATRRYEGTNQYFWSRARSYIERVLGESPPIREILDKCDFTAGASIGVGGNKTNLARKFFASYWSTTPSALPYAKAALWNNIHARHCILPGAMKCYDPHLFGGIVDTKVASVNCNNIVFVPKTALTHRSIAVEPLLNGYVQKGIDVYMRKQLRKVGIDLMDQTPNQLLAYAGSLGGSNPYCTIDLASASDSLSCEVVKDLLPRDWYNFLAEVRSPRYTLHGESHSYEKFCSMGNGFCFPLQSLIFAAVCHASLQETGDCTDNFCVYGDDIVVPQNVALLVIERLGDIGFAINTGKTFIFGPFRESCGRDWFNGQDVRPVTLDTRMTDIRQVCAFHNSTLRSGWCTTAFEQVRTYLRTFRAQLLRPGVEPGDTCFSVPLDLAMCSPLVRWDKRTQQWSWIEIASKSTADVVRLGDIEYESILEYAVLAGSQSARPFTLRYATKAKRAVVSRPFWDVLRSPFGYGASVVLDASLCQSTNKARGA